MKKQQLAPRFGPNAPSQNVTVYLEDIVLNYRRGKPPVTARLNVSGTYTVPASLYPLLREEELFGYGKYCGAFGAATRLRGNARTFPRKGRALIIDTFAKVDGNHSDRTNSRIRLYFYGSIALPAVVVTSRSREDVIAFAIKRQLLGRICTQLTEPLVALPA
jgi:hypothetical protein